MRLRIGFLAMAAAVAFMVPAGADAHVAVNRVGDSLTLRDFMVASGATRIQRVDVAFPEDLVLRASNYYLALESDYPRGGGGVFRDMQDGVIYEGSPEFKEAANVEGSALLDDGRTINFAGRVKGDMRWKVVTAPYGIGAECPLVPMRSAAVDRSLVPLGSILYIPKTTGIVLPDGEIHDGIWYAVDTGGNIKQDRIDLFTGSGIASMDLIYDHGIGHLEGLTVEVVGALDGCNELVD